MARIPRLRLRFNEASLLDHLQQMYLALTDKVAKCNRQMTLLTNLIKSPSDAVTLQGIFANVEKAIATCHTHRIEIIKIQKDMITTMRKEDKKKIEKNDSLSEEQIIAMQRRFADLKKQTRAENNDF